MVWGEGSWAAGTSLVHPLVGLGTSAMSWSKMGSGKPLGSRPQPGHTMSLGSALGFGEGGVWIGGVVEGLELLGVFFWCWCRVGGVGLVVWIWWCRVEFCVLV